MLRPGLAAALALAVAALGCGDTLVDHGATDLLKPATPCDPAACPDPNPAWTGARKACLGTPGSQVCGYECTGGFLKCPDGCCPAQAVAAGDAHTCAITTAGGLYCWGADDSGQVSGGAGGVGAIVSSPLKLRDSGVTAVALGTAHTCAIVSGSITCWGLDTSGQAPAAVSVSSPSALAAGTSHTCAIDGTGAVKCWGATALGQRGGTASPVATPAIGGTATAISAGANHTCALVGGAVKCWGAGASGQLGFDPAPSSTMDPVAAGTLTGIGAIGAGTNLSCAAPVAPSGGNIDDALQCWGSGLGTLLPADPQATPSIPMKDGSHSVVRFDVNLLAVGRAHVCVKRNGVAESVKCLGSDDAWGQLGGTAIVPPEPVDVPGTQNASAFAVGADHGCAVLSSGGVECWGRNSSGQLGDGTQVTPGLSADVRPIGTPVTVSGR